MSPPFLVRAISRNNHEVSVDAAPLTSVAPSEDCTEYVALSLSLLPSSARRRPERRKVQQWGCVRAT
jgi:hypothetical protein